MAKLIRLADGCYRMRRGRLVKIPPRWVGNTLSKQTKRKRQSKFPRKWRMVTAMYWPGRRPLSRSPRHGCWGKRADVWDGWE